MRLAWCLLVSLCLSCTQERSAYSPGCLKRSKFAPQHQGPPYPSHLDRNFHPYARLHSCVLHSRYSQDYDGDPGGLEDEEVSDQSMLSGQLLMAVESLNYHSGAVYINYNSDGDDHHTGNVEPNDSSMAEDEYDTREQQRKLQLLCEYTCPTCAGNPMGPMSTYEITDSEGKLLGLLVFLESKNTRDMEEGRGEGGEDQRDMKETRGEQEDSRRRERLVGGILSSVRITLMKLRVQGVEYFPGDSCSGHRPQKVGELVAQEAQSSIITSRTMLKMLSRRLKSSDEIGNELVDNIYIQLDHLSSLLSQSSSGDEIAGIGFGYEEVSSPVPSQASSVIAQLGNEYSSESTLPLNIVSFQEDVDEKDKNPKMSGMYVSSVKSIDDEFWSPSKKEEVISLDKDEESMNSEERVDSGGDISLEEGDGNTVA